jgi:serine protease
MKVLLALALAIGVLPCAYGQSRSDPEGAAVEQIIVQWRKSSASSAEAKAAAASFKTGVALRRKAAISADMEVLALERALSKSEADSLLAQLATSPDVEFAVADERRYAHAAPSDPLLALQWYLLSAQPGATRMEAAWDVTMGSATSVVAVLDTGVRFEHPDLGRAQTGGKLLPGFDFISNAAVANDGGGRDGDPTDPGDWLTAAETQQPPFNTSNCLEPGQSQRNSSWHGTRVASLIGAMTNNAQGMAGGGWSTLILPLRVLGKCGGSDSDILAAMRWAAGLVVPGIPVNPTPAKVINLSLGATGACSAAYQTAIPEITAQGALVVASVGNEGGPVGSPANCPGVLGVTGLRHAGTKVGFSSLGPQAAIGAPGGNCVNTVISPPDSPCEFSIVVATNTGATTPASSTYTDQFNFNVGTSFAAPLVAAAAALMHAANPQLEPASLAGALRRTASPFPATSTTTSAVCRIPGGPADIQNQECICTTQTCGAGMLNAHAAVLASQRLFAIVQAPGTIDVGVATQLDARASFAPSGRRIIAYRWSVLDITGATPAIAELSQALTTLQTTGPSQFTLRLVVTDDLGGEDAADLAIATSAPLTPSPSPSPAPTPSPAAPRGGGGGATSLLLIAALLAAACARRYCGGSSFCARSRRYS